MGVRQFRKKPVVIEAIQFTGDNGHEVLDFIGSDYERAVIVIHTLGGSMTAEVGDWIIKGAEGEFYTCKPDIFDVYEEVEGKDTFLATLALLLILGFAGAVTLAFFRG